MMLAESVGPRASDVLDVKGPTIGPEVMGLPVLRGAFPQLLDRDIFNFVSQAAV
jgi:hypothetical protein